MERRVIGAQNISRMCMVCGRENPFGLRARFYELDTGELLGVFSPEQVHQSYPGRLHGGMSSAMLDETIGRAIDMGDSEVWGVTVELTVRFRAPVPLEGEVRVIGRITRDSSRVFEGSGELLLADGTVAAEAAGKYLKMPIDRIAEGDFQREWFADERWRPATIELPDR